MAVAFVQAAGNPTSYNTVTCAYPSNNTVGNMLIVSGSFYGSTAVGISDSQGNVWVPIFNIPSSAGANLFAWVCYSCKAGANTVTVTPNYGPQFSQFCVSEYSGVGAIESVEYGSDTGGGNFSCGTMYNTQAGSLIYAGYTAGSSLNASQFTAGTGYTLRAVGANVSGQVGHGIEDMAVPGAGTASGTAMTVTGGAGNGLAFLLSPVVTPIYSRQAAIFYTVPAVATLTPKFSVPTITGNTIVVAIQLYNGDPATVITSVVDSTGTNVYVAIPGTYQYQSALQSGTVFYICVNATGIASNTITVNLIPINSISYSTAMVWEVVGCSASPIDASAIGFSTTSTFTAATAPFTTTGANDLILGYAWGRSVTGQWTPNSPFNPNFLLSTLSNAGLTGLVTPGTYTPALTQSSSQANVIAAVALKAFAAVGLPNFLALMGCGT